MAGALNTGVGLAAYPILFFALASFELHYLVVLAISQVLCITFSFLTNKFLVFRTSGNYLQEYGKFIIFHIFYFAFNLIALPVLVEFVKLSPVWAQSLFAVFIVITSYFWHSRVTFLKSAERSPMEGSQYLKRKCPVCQINTYRANGKVVSETTAESLGFDELVPGWNGFFKEKVFFSYERCDGCGLLYAPTFFNGSQLERLYAQMPPNMDEVPIQALRRTQKGYFDTLRKHSNLNGAYIEVGPDIGLFTENCVREGTFDEYWLFEPNMDVKTNLDRLMQGKRKHIIHDMFGFNQVPNGAASVAVMVHVLDHLLDPVGTLKELEQKMAPKSRLLVVTHDESSLLRRFVGWRWPAFCMQHPQLYSPASMQSLLAKAGFRVIAQRKTTNHFQIKFLLKHLLWALGWKVKSVPSFWNITVGLKLGNMLTIAAPLEEKS